MCYRLVHENQKYLPLLYVGDLNNRRKDLVVSIEVFPSLNITHTHSVLMAIFPGEPGLAAFPLILLLHLFLDCTSFWDRPKLSMPFLIQSHQVFFGHPLCPIPSTSHVIQRLTQSLSSFRSTCPNHLNLLFLIIKLTGSKRILVKTESY